MTRRACADGRFSDTDANDLLIAADVGGAGFGPSGGGGGGSVLAVDATSRVLNARMPPGNGSVTITALDAP